MKKNIIHLIAGYNFPTYFKNCILSLITKSLDAVVIVCVTGRNKDDKKVFNEINKIKKNYNFRGIIIYKYFKENKFFLKTKVGNLYECYNYALDYSYKKKYKILNIIQNDMQVMNWNNNYFLIAKEIFKKIPSCISCVTGYPRIGSHPNFYNEIKLGNHKIYLTTLGKMVNIFYDKNTGIGDWGLYNLERLKKLNFKFKNNEKFMGKYLNNLKYKLFYFPKPFISVVPWPVIVRQGRKFGSFFKFNKLIMKINEKKKYKLLVNKNKLFQEDFFVPNNWNCLYPPNYTDFSIRRYLRIIKKCNQLHNKKFPYYFDGKSIKSIFTFFCSLNTKLNFYELCFYHIKSSLIRFCKKN